MSGGPAWSPTEDALLCALWLGGYTITYIATQIPGRSRPAIAMRRKKLDLPGRPQVRKQSHTRPDVLALLDNARRSGAI